MGLRQQYMKPIDSTFKSDGFMFQLVKRQSLIAMFSKSKHGHESFEVVVLQIHKACVFPNGISYPDRETMPSSELWGQQGWTYTDLASANKRYYALQNAV